MPNYNILILALYDAIKTHSAAAHTHSCFIRNNCESIADWLDEMVQWEYAYANKTRIWVDEHKQQAKQFEQDIENLKSIATLLRVKQKATSTRLKKYSSSGQYENIVKNRKSNIESVKHAIETYSDTIIKNKSRICIEKDIIKTYQQLNNNDSLICVDMTDHLAQIELYTEKNIYYKQNIKNLKTVIRLLKRQR